MTASSRGEPRPRATLHELAIEQLDIEKLPVGSRVAVEGEFGARIDNTIALKGCAVGFVLAPGARINLRLEELSAGSYLRLEGTVAYREVLQRYYVLVSLAEPAANFLQQLTRAIEDPASTPESLYEIAKKARKSAETQPDEKLRQRANAAVAAGLKMEAAALDEEDWQAYLRLTHKAEKLLPAGPQKAHYARAGVEAFVTSKGRRKAATFYEAAAMVEDVLPDDPLSEELFEHGFAIEKGTAGRDGPTDYYALAARSREIFGQGRRYYRLLRRALEEERSKIARDDYAAMYALARKIMRLYPGYIDYRGIVTLAVIAEKESMDRADAEAWNRLGNRVLFFLDDQMQAAIYFMEASTLDPGNATAADKLAELGYVYHKGRWLLPGRFASQEAYQRARQLEELAAAGKLAVGMSRDQVLRSKGTPARVNISAGGWGHTIQWVYQAGQKQSYVNFVSETVVSIGNGGA